LPVALDVGSPAPDFTLPAWTAQGRADLTLSAQQGAPVVLAFYPGDDTLVCTKQLCSYQDDLGMLTDLGAVLWGISAQDLESHELFACKRGLSFPLLADTDKAVHRQYGAAGRLGLPRRAVFVVDAQGLLAWQHVSTLGLTYQDTATISAVLDGLRSKAG
jgi:peroxiredoxin Q/BCP